MKLAMVPWASYDHVWSDGDLVSIWSPLVSDFSSFTKSAIIPFYENWEILTVVFILETSNGKETNIDIYYFEIGISSPTETYHFGFCFCVSEVFSLSWTFSILCYLFSFSHFYCYFLLLWRGGRREEV